MHDITYPQPAVHARVDERSGFIRRACFGSPPDVIPSAGIVTALFFGGFTPVAFTGSWHRHPMTEAATTTVRRDVGPAFRQQPRRLETVTKKLKHALRRSPAASTIAVACLLHAVPASAQPRTFCLTGVTWETVNGVPPGPAREVTLIEHFSLSGQMMFRSPRLLDQMLLSVHDTGTCLSCHGPAKSESERTAEILNDVKELIFIEPSQRNTWFGQEYSAFLARRTPEACQPDGASTLLAGPPTVEGVLRHREAGSDIRFIIESEAILRGLEVPETAPVLVSPRP